MCQFQCNEPTQVFLLADRQHLPNPAADPEEAEATLTVRDLPNSPATPLTELNGHSSGRGRRSGTAAQPHLHALRVRAG